MTVNVRYNIPVPLKNLNILQIQEDRTNVTKCILCSGGVDTSAEEHNALQATMWSTIVSGKGKTLGKFYIFM